MRRYSIDRAPSTPTRGVEGNFRLTAITSAVLVGLLLVEGFTILNVRGYLTLHTALGLVLIGPVGLKTASTSYRFVRYYQGRPAYVRKGPPHPILRVLGPLVVLSTIAVLATGVGLLLDQGRSHTVLTLHQASFIVWISVTGLHFLGHVVEATRGTARELRALAAHRRNSVLRLLALAGSLAFGVGLAIAFTPPATSWR